MFSPSFSSWRWLVSLALFVFYYNYYYYYNMHKHIHSCIGIHAQQLLLFTLFRDPHTHTHTLPFSIEHFIFIRVFLIAVSFALFVLMSHRSFVIFQQESISYYMSLYGWMAGCVSVYFNRSQRNGANIPQTGLCRSYNWFFFGKLAASRWERCLRVQLIIQRKKLCTHFVRGILFIWMLMSQRFFILLSLWVCLCAWVSSSLNFSFFILLCIK